MVLRISLSGILSLTVLFMINGCAPLSSAPRVGGKGIYHVVRAGENLYRIGKAYDISYEELARVNRLRHADQIRVGQKIFVPGAIRQLPVDVITPAQSTMDLWISPEAAGQSPSDPSGSASIDQKFIWPISGTINSRFGPRGSSFHDGIDIAAPEGTPIRAIDAGAVIYSGHLRGYGNMVILRHLDGLVSVYAHNESNLVREGQHVSRGETIARVGSTGRVTGPHLHFEIRRRNKAEDPLPHMPRLCCAAASDSINAGG
jgi:murein DD-endopeptidase MepM/ murein hydrolase activator NlpD